MCYDVGSISFGRNFLIAFLIDETFHLRKCPKLFAIKNNVVGCTLCLGHEVVRRAGRSLFFFFSTAATVEMGVPQHSLPNIHATLTIDCVRTVVIHRTLKTFGWRSVTDQLVLPWQRGASREETGKRISFFFSSKTATKKFSHRREWLETLHVPPLPPLP